MNQLPPATRNALHSIPGAKELRLPSAAGDFRVWHAVMCEIGGPAARLCESCAAAVNAEGGAIFHGKTAQFAANPAMDDNTEIWIIYPATPTKLAAMFDFAEFGQDMNADSPELRIPGKSTNEPEARLVRREGAKLLLLEMASETPVTLCQLFPHRAMVMTLARPPRDWADRWAERVWKFNLGHYTPMQGEKDGIRHDFNECSRLARKLGVFDFGF